MFVFSHPNFHTGTPTLGHQSGNNGDKLNNSPYE